LSRRWPNSFLRVASANLARGAVPNHSHQESDGKGEDHEHNENAVLEEKDTPELGKRVAYNTCAAHQF
jgi:hypothetical protein